MRREPMTYCTFPAAGAQPPATVFDWFEVVLSVGYDQTPETLIVAVEALLPAVPPGTRIELSPVYGTLCLASGRVEPRRSVSLVASDLSPYEVTEPPVAVGMIQAHLRLMGIASEPHYLP
jgi:hypothetical protein